MVVRELTGDVYFGEPKGITTDPSTGERTGWDPPRLAPGLGTLQPPPPKTLLESAHSSFQSFTICRTHDARLVGSEGLTT